MERGSDKHASRLDDALSHDAQSIVQGQGAESRAQEHREQEGPGEGEPTPDSRIAGGRPLNNPQWPTDDEIEARSELARHLDPSTFPARPSELRANAERNHAPTWVVDMLAALSDDATYETTEEVWVALGGSRERRP